MRQWKTNMHGIAKTPFAFWIGAGPCDEVSFPFPGFEEKLCQGLQGKGGSIL
jgi:hypothetical protein